MHAACTEHRLAAGAELSDSDYSEADEVEAPPKRRTPAKPRQNRLAALLGSGFAGALGEGAEAAEDERATRDAFWHGFGGTSKAGPPAACLTALLEPADHLLQAAHDTEPSVSTPFRLPCKCHVSVLSAHTHTHTHTHTSRLRNSESTAF